MVHVHEDSIYQEKEASKQVNNNGISNAQTII